MSEFKYTWEPPIVRVRDFVKWRRHQGQIRTGWVNDVETHYYSDGSHHHSYSIQHKRGGARQCVGGDQILKVLGRECPDCRGSGIDYAEHTDCPHCDGLGIEYNDETPTVPASEPDGENHD